MSAQQLEFEYQYQCVALMLVNGTSLDPADKVFRNADAARRKLTPNTAGYWYDEHVKLQAEEAQHWGIAPTLDPFLAEIAKLLKMGEDVDPEDIVAEVQTQLMLGSLPDADEPEE